MKDHPKDKKNYSSKEGYTALGGRVRIHGFSEPPREKLDAPLSAGGGSVRVELKPGRYSWCTCGHSKEQPFCDHAHREAQTNRKSYKFEVLEAVNAYICMCKRTNNPPFCDGECEPFE